MGFEVVLVCAFLCILQFHIGDVECNDPVTIQVRVRPDTIKGYSQNPLYSSVPYVLNRRGNNKCNSRGSVCNRNCGSNNSYRFNSPQNGFLISMPSTNSNDGRLTLIVNTKKTDNGEMNKQIVDVLCEFKNISKNNPSITTSGKSKAVKNKYGDVLTANTDGIVNIPGLNLTLNCSVFVKDTSKNLGKTLLINEIQVKYGDLDSRTKTWASIINNPEDKSDKADPTDTPVTGGASKAEKPDNKEKPPKNNPTQDDSTPEPKKEKSAPSSPKPDKKPEETKPAEPPSPKKESKPEEEKPSPEKEDKPEEEKPSSEKEDKPEEEKPSPKKEDKPEEEKPSPKKEDKPEEEKPSPKKEDKPEEEKPSPKKEDKPEEEKPSPKKEDKPEEEKPSPEKEDKPEKEEAESSSPKDEDEPEEKDSASVAGD